MILYVKNTDSVSHTWGGQIIASGDSFLVPEADLRIWQTDDSFLAAIGAGTALLNDGSKDITTVSQELRYLNGNQPVSSNGYPIFEPAIVSGAPGTGGLSVVTPNLGDRTTWYQKSFKVTNETLTTGDDLTFSSANPWWIDACNSRLTYSFGNVPKRDSTWGHITDWMHVISVNGTPLANLSGYTVNFAAGTITFATSQTGNTITATYWTNQGVTQPSEWLFVPATNYRYTVQCVELQYSMNIPSVMDTIRFEVWAGASLAKYTGNVAPAATVATSATITPLSGAGSTTTTASFTQPAASSTVTVAVVDTSWMTVSQPLFVSGGGFYVVASIPSSTSVVLLNLGYTSFSQSLYSLGYGQFRADYRGVWDIINVTNNQSSTVIPKHGPMSHDLFIAPFNYTQALVLNSSQGAVLRMCLVNDTPIPDVELASACFYLQRANLAV